MAVDAMGVITRRERNAPEGVLVLFARAKRTNKSIWLL